MKKKRHLFFLFLPFIFSCALPSGQAPPTPEPLSVGLRDDIRAVFFDELHDLYFTPLGISFTAEQLQWLMRNRRWIAYDICRRISEGSQIAIQLADYLKLHQAIPALRKQMLTLRGLYGGDGLDLSKKANRVDDYYPINLMHLEAIENITGLPIYEALQLTDDERAYLLENADVHHPTKGTAWCAAWLLKRLAPMEWDDKNLRSKIDE